MSFILIKRHFDSSHEIEPQYTKYGEFATEMAAVDFVDEDDGLTLGQNALGDEFVLIDLEIHGAGAVRGHWILEKRANWIPKRA